MTTLVLQILLIWKFQPQNLKHHHLFSAELHGVEFFSQELPHLNPGFPVALSLPRQ
jgi:hypothetical protein